MKRLLPLAAAVAPMLVLAACVPPAAPPPERPAPRQRPSHAAPRPAPTPPARDWSDWPYTPGDWVYRQDARGSIALFGAPNQNASLTLRCDRERRMLYLSHAGTAPAALTIRTTSLTRVLDAQPTGGTPPYVAVALAVRDPLLDAMAFSRGRIALTMPGAAPLVVPAWAELGRVIEDCRG